MAGPLLPLDKTATEIAERWRTGPVLVRGPVASGKLTALQAADAILANGEGPALAYNANDYTTIEDLIGRTVQGENGQHLEAGPLTLAMREGRRLIIADAERLTGDARAAFLAAVLSQPLPALPGVHVTTLERPGFAVGASIVGADFEISDAFAHVFDFS